MEVSGRRLITSGLIVSGEERKVNAGNFLAAVLEMFLRFFGLFSCFDIIEVLLKIPVRPRDWKFSWKMKTGQNGTNETY